MKDKSSPEYKDKFSYNINVPNAIFSFCFIKKGQIKFSHERNWIVFLYLLEELKERKKSTDYFLINQAHNHKLNFIL